MYGSDCNSNGGLPQVIPVQNSCCPRPYCSQVALHHHHVHPKLLDVTTEPKVFNYTSGSCMKIDTLLDRHREQSRENEELLLKNIKAVYDEKLQTRLDTIEEKQDMILTLLNKVMEQFTTKEDIDTAIKDV